MASGRGRLGPAEVFDAEALGALEGLKHAVSAPEDAQLCKTHVCLDNLAAAQCLVGRPSDSSQAVFAESRNIARTHRVHEKWCPGHEDIAGNRADALAKPGALLDTRVLPPCQGQFVQHQRKHWHREPRSCCDRCLPDGLSR